MKLELIFNLANLFVLPFWLLMVVLPNWSITRRVMASFLPFVALASLYVFLFVGSFDAGSMQSFSNPTLAGLAQLFSMEAIMATGWVHYLVMDLFVGRWIYWEGQRRQILTTHSLILCLFAGPMGLLSHILTRWIVDRFFPGSSGAAIDAAVAEPDSTLS